jgi:hypothetical protein
MESIGRYSPSSKEALEDYHKLLLSAEEGKWLTRDFDPNSRDLFNGEFLIYLKGFGFRISAEPSGLDDPEKLAMVKYGLEIVDLEESVIVTFFDENYHGDSTSVEDGNFKYIDTLDDWCAKVSVDLVEGDGPLRRLYEDVQKKLKSYGHKSLDIPQESTRKLEKLLDELWSTRTG